MRDGRVMPAKEINHTIDLIQHRIQDIKAAIELSKMMTQFKANLKEYAELKLQVKEEIGKLQDATAKLHRSVIAIDIEPIEIVLFLLSLLVSVEPYVIQ
jgi:hypothetical protein